VGPEFPTQGRKMGLRTPEPPPPPRPSPAVPKRKFRSTYCATANKKITAVGFNGTKLLIRPYGLSDWDTPATAERDNPGMGNEGNVELA
jgi:hypothetical protein